MRHKKKGRHLGRSTPHRKALLKNMAAQVIEHKEVKTTLAKAKELRGYVERLITYGKKGTLHHRRLAFQALQNKEAVTRLFDEIAPQYETRPGGYTRIIKLGNRKGDNAEMSVIQLVGFEESAKSKKPKTARKEKTAEKQTDAAPTEEVVEPVTEKEEVSDVVSEEVNEADENAAETEDKKEEK